MRLFRFFSAVAVTVLTVTPTFAARCSTYFPATERAQLHALQDFADLFLIQKDVQKAFDAYIPGTYIQHNPSVLSGRENALNFLKPLFGAPNVIFNISTVFAGQGQGILHYRFTIPGQVDLAIMDRFRFNGTCIEEHWDVQQQIVGNETNPLAFF